MADHPGSVATKTKASISNTRASLFGKAAGKEILSTGGRQIETIADWNKAEQQATKYYQKIRSTQSNTDVVTISKILEFLSIV